MQRLGKREIEQVFAEFIPPFEQQIAHAPRHFVIVFRPTAIEIDLDIALGLGVNAQDDSAVLQRIDHANDECCCHGLQPLRAQPAGSTGRLRLCNLFSIG